MDAKELKKILKEHAAWLENDSKGTRADLRRANLQGANLQGANLRRANLQWADLRMADLRMADLRMANLQGANLQGAYLQGAYLQMADLQGADLRMANLQGANLQGAYLRMADLRMANLQGAYLQGADLRMANLQVANLQWADLRMADLRMANLQGANLQGADLKDEILIAYTSITPEGTLVGWKKCKDRIIVKMSIPPDSPRSNAAGRKCRAKFVDVLEVFGAEKGVSQHDGKTEYIVGQRVECDNWDEDRWNECSGGIHFFLTRHEAENY